MARHISAEEAQKSLPELLDLACKGEQPIIVERDGRPVGVLIGPEQYERYLQYVREQFRRTVDELQALNADKDPDEILRDVTEVVEEVRRERYERERLKQ